MKGRERLEIQFANPLGEMISSDFILRFLLKLSTLVQDRIVLLRHYMFCISRNENLKGLTHIACISLSLEK